MIYLLIAAESGSTISPPHSSSYNVNMYIVVVLISGFGLAESPTKHMLYPWNWLGCV